MGCRMGRHHGFLGPWKSLGPNLRVQHIPETKGVWDKDFGPFEKVPRDVVCSSSPGQGEWLLVHLTGGNTSHCQWKDASLSSNNDINIIDTDRPTQLSLTQVMVSPVRLAVFLTRRLGEL